MTTKLNITYEVIIMIMMMPSFYENPQKNNL